MTTETAPSRLELLCLEKGLKMTDQRRTIARQKGTAATDSTHVPMHHHGSGGASIPPMAARLSL